MKKLMEMKHKHAPYKLAFLRIVVGALFIAHGTAKWGMWQAAPNEQMSAMMLWIMRILSVVEPLAGLALILGLFVPVTGMIIAIIMIGAIPLKITQFGAPFAGGWSYDLLILAAAMVLVSHGGGKPSLDDVMHKKNHGMPPMPPKPPVPPVSPGQNI